MFGPSGSSGSSSAGDLDPTTAYGFLETTEDALLVVQATRQGMCQRITRRLLQKEQHYVRSGAIFVYDEEEAGMKRWTDKFNWSPSRQIGSFFIYRQMTVKIPRGTTTKEIAALTAPASGEWPIIDPDAAASERKYVGSLTSSPTYPREGLIKRTLALGTIHVISYFTLDHVMSGALQTPSSSPMYYQVDIPMQLRALVQTAGLGSSGRSSQSGLEGASPSSSRGFGMAPSASPQPISPFDPEPLSRGRRYSMPGFQPVPPVVQRSPSSRTSTSYSASGMASSFAPISPLRLDTIPSGLEYGSFEGMAPSAPLSRPRSPSLGFGNTGAPPPPLRRYPSASSSRRSLQPVPEPISVPSYQHQSSSSSIWPAGGDPPPHSASVGYSSYSSLGQPSSFSSGIASTSASTSYAPSYVGYAQPVPRRPSSPSNFGSSSFQQPNSAFPLSSYSIQRPASPGSYTSGSTLFQQPAQSTSAFSSSLGYSLPRPSSPAAAGGGGYPSTSAQQPTYPSRRRRPSSPLPSPFSSTSGALSSFSNPSVGPSQQSFSTFQHQQQQQSQQQQSQQQYQPPQQQWQSSPYQFQQFQGRYMPSERYHGGSGGNEQQ